MAKKLFKNYNYEFDSNERKVLSTFCKQALSQMSGDEKFFKEQRVFESLVEKLNSGEEQIKLTKEESTKLAFHLRENVKNMKEQIEKSWFIKKWLMKSMYKQYTNILATHFEN